MRVDIRQLDRCIGDGVSQMGGGEQEEEGREEEGVGRIRRLVTNMYICLMKKNTHLSVSLTKSAMQSVNIIVMTQLNVKNIKQFHCQ